MINFLGIIAPEIYYGNSSYFATHILTICDNIRRRTAQSSYQKIKTWSLNKYWHSNVYSIQKRKISNNPNHRISYRAFRMRTLLDHYINIAAHYLPRLWEHHKPIKESDIISRRSVILS